MAATSNPNCRKVRRWLDSHCGATVTAELNWSDIVVTTQSVLSSSGELKRSRLKERRGKQHLYLIGEIPLDLAWLPDEIVFVRNTGITGILGDDISVYFADQHETGCLMLSVKVDKPRPGPTFADELRRSGRGK